MIKGFSVIKTCLYKPFIGSLIAFLTLAGGGAICAKEEHPSLIVNSKFEVTDTACESFKDNTLTLTYNDDKEFEDVTIEEGFTLELKNNTNKEIYIDANRNFTNKGKLIIHKNCTFTSRFYGQNFGTIEVFGNGEFKIAESPFDSLQNSVMRFYDESQLSLEGNNIVNIQGFIQFFDQSNLVCGNGILIIDSEAIIELNNNSCIGSVENIINNGTVKINEYSGLITKDIFFNKGTLDLSNIASLVNFQVDDIDEEYIANFGKIILPIACEKPTDREFYIRSMYGSTIEYYNKYPYLDNGHVKFKTRDEADLPSYTGFTFEDNTTFVQIERSLTLYDLSKLCTINKKGVTYDLTSDETLEQDTELNFDVDLNGNMLTVKNSILKINGSVRGRGTILIEKDATLSGYGSVIGVRIINKGTSKMQKGSTSKSYALKIWRAGDIFGGE